MVIGLPRTQDKRKSTKQTTTNDSKQMRPTYENSDSLKAEEQTIRKVAEVWKSTYVKLPIQHRVDWALLRGGLVAWCECKRRYNNKDKRHQHHGLQMYNQRPPQHQ